MGTPVDIRNALETRAKAAITAISATLPIEEENIPFARPSTGKWAQIYWVSGAKRVLTLGLHGLDLHYGVYQITLVYPIGDGTGNARSNIQTLNSYFPLSQIMSSNGQVVRVTGTEAPPGREVGSSHRVTFSINWEAEIPR